MLRHIPGILMFSVWLSSCGSLNVNELLESTERKNAIDALIQEAQYEYDKGNYQRALSKAQKARSIRPEAEHATVLLSQIHLGLAGLDTLSLAKGLVKKDEDTGEEQDKTASTFAKLAEVIGLSTADLEALSTETNGGETADEALLYLPKSTSEARVSTSSILANIKAAVEYLCPFIGDEAKLLEADGALYDDRHDDCEPIEGSQLMGAQANFAWAVAHLGEAITFYSLIFYQDPNSSDPNIVTRSKALDSYKNEPLVYIEKITELADVVDAIFPTDADDAGDAMLNAMFNNLETTGLGFAAIAGLPEDFSKSVQEALANVRGKLSNIDKPTKADNNTALKNSLTKGLSRQLAKQIEESSANDVQQLNDICDAFVKINSETPKPQKCP
ncbi:MAG: hypothetical protein ACOH5I_24710 [Oligoflexus sp.]